MTHQPEIDTLGEFLISARSLAEYRAIFALTEADLDGRILDCPGGAASFTTEASELGAAVIAADPISISPPCSNSPEYPPAKPASTHSSTTSAPAKTIWSPTCERSCTTRESAPHSGKPDTNSTTAQRLSSFCTPTRAARTRYDNGAATPLVTAPRAQVSVVRRDQSTHLRISVRTAATTASTIAATPHTTP